MSTLRNSHVGDTLDPGGWGPLTQTDIVRFAGAGGDFNPLHHDPEAAQRAGFDRPIAMGQMTAGLLSSWLSDWCGVENLQYFSVRFVSPVHIGDTLRFEAKVIEVDPQGPTATLNLTASAGDRVTITGTARILDVINDRGHHDK